ncbi:MAG: hypothetical protein IOC39_24185 [Burkholderia sp.]|uniref:hypothetical protein n=1 Tax=Burkholderia sp. TaxID=36773 RepID=UPI002583DC75|nr:hypothetical protein [Burkholderia sp.]MCA3780139.1 hypothetical protein [Burkholderia sp.]MCA3798438.1 hypothetical protein [Burkholderia sp.]MCA3804820.1 hypothetical protein [Burkholderia sp.]MCA3812273.1 hypothetical protein [Burkholderia sp.]MCA3818920.1 hypothetical protein [Burkholderia sp.]
MDRHQASPAVTVREVGADVARPLLARVDAFDTSGGVDTVASMTTIGRCFVIAHDGRDVGAYVLQRQGNECFVLAAQGGAEFDLTAFLSVVVEAHARGLASIAFQTRRPGLIRKAKRYGYYIAGRAPEGVVMRKDLQ